jgi:hypothetical protein
MKSVWRHRAPIPLTLANPRLQLRLVGAASEFLKHA